MAEKQNPDAIQLFGASMFEIELLRWLRKLSCLQSSALIVFVRPCLKQ